MSRAWVFSELEEMDYPKLGLAKLEFDSRQGFQLPGSSVYFHPFIESFDAIFFSLSPNSPLSVLPLSRLSQ
jgi:hypothetical protein